LAQTACEKPKPPEKKVNPFAALETLKGFKKIKLDKIDSKADPKRVLADFMKDLQRVCN